MEEDSYSIRLKQVASCMNVITDIKILAHRSCYVKDNVKYEQYMQTAKKLEKLKENRDINKQYFNQFDAVMGQIEQLSYENDEQLRKVYPTIEQLVSTIQLNKQMEKKDRQR